MGRQLLWLLAIVGMAWPAGAAAGSASKREPAKLGAVFVSVPKDFAAGISHSIESRCPTVDIVRTEIVDPDARDTTSSPGAPDAKPALDGLMLFCGALPDHRHLQTGLPTILVDCTAAGSPAAEFEQAVALAKQCGTRLITAGCRPDANGDASAADLESLAEKVNLLGVLKRLKGSKLIAIQDHDGYNRIDQGIYYQVPIQEYDREYPGRLEESLGIEIVVVRSDELNRLIAELPEGAAEKVAHTWVDEATEVKNVTDRDILRAARSYLAQRELLKRYDADAITLETATLAFKAYGSDKMEGFGEVRAAQPLVIMELSKEYVPACCQSHIDCLVTQMVGTSISGGSGFTGDFLNDWAFKPSGERPKDVMIVAHCGAPITPYGHDRLPYLIRDHIHNRAFGPKETPTATTVDWPSHEPASIVKFDVYRKQVSIFTGEVLDGNALYKNFPNCICRNKIVIRIDDPGNCYMLPSKPNAGAFRQCNHWDRKHRHWGGHQVAFYGNLKPAVRDLAALIGFEVVDGR